MSDDLENNVAYLLRENIEIKVRLEMMEKDIIAIRSINKVLALCLCDLGPESKEKMMKLLEAISHFADHMEEKPSGPMVRHFLNDLLPLVESSSPLKLIIYLTLLGQDAGPDRLPALREWHAQATPDEIAQEIRELCEKLGHPLPPEM